MASSALSGDRRLASSRRGAMMVLGKVAVPKPINLPSQRLENHGLDPNVEIVPKGTLSWGSRTSTMSNAWGTSILSPRTDGGTLSPSNLSTHPSSGESGTRPSTAGSDRANDSSTTAWGSNSRPSSASGAHASSQTPIVSLRPRSAETRPGSSQLSRFAETSAENSVGGVLERLGMTSSRNDGFSLSSGDFPVLGSEKNGSGKSTASQEHPSQGSVSPSSVAAQCREDNEVKTGVLNSWRREDAVFCEDGVRSGIDQWHGESPFPNSGMRPQHFNAWRGPIVNNHPPSSSWYRGPPGGPYRGPVAPSGFPMEPFPYYHHQGAPPVLPNPPSAPSSGSLPRCHPNNGEFYRPPIPGAFICPNMPVRPGFYPAPLPCDGYFGPQLRYRSPNEQDIAFAGMAPGVSAPYCRYPSAENGNLNARPAGFDGKMSSSEGGELGHLRESGGQYKVLLKQHDSWEGEGEELQQGDSKAESPLNLGSRSKTVNPENDSKLERTQGIEKNTEIGDPKESPKFDERVNTSFPWRVSETLPAHADGVDPARRFTQKRSTQEVSQSVSAAARDSNLIQKVESLNAKSRASDTRSDALPASDRCDQDAFPQSSLLPYSAAEIKNETQLVKKNQDTRNFTPEQSGQIFPAGGKIHGRNAASGAVVSRRTWKSSATGRRVGTPDANEWHKNPIGVDSVVPAMETLNLLPNNEVGDHSISHPLKNDGESKPVAIDSSDTPAERARLRELAKQRAIRRQEEEEERARDQKARAHLKLEELNKRRQLEESLNTKTDTEQQQGLHAPLEKAKESTIMPSHGSVSETSPVSQINERMTGFEGSTILSGDEVSSIRRQIHCQQGESSAGVVDHNPEDISYKHIHVMPKEKPTRVSGEPAKRNERTTDVAKSDELLDDINPGTDKTYPTNPQDVVETTVHQRKKESRTVRTKQRVDNVSPASVSVDVVNEASRASTRDENGMLKSLNPDLESKFIQQLPDSKDLKESTEHPLATSTVNTQVRFSFHGGSQHPRGTPRNQQTNKLSEKMHGSDAVMWAPRSQNKVEAAVQTNDGTPAEEPNSSLKNDTGQKNAKHKRTEMERYIPKPVAKEMAQQGYASQAVPLNSKSGLVEETLQGASSVSRSIENARRSSGSWRQRSPKESMPERESHFVDSGKHDRIMGEDQSGNEPRMRHSKEKQKFPGHVSGDWLNPSFDSDPNAEVFRATSDHGSVARVKRNNHHATGSNLDIKQKKGGELSGKSHTQSSVFDQHQKSSAAISKESHGSVDRSTSQWQPKAPKVSADDLPGSKPSGGKWVEVGDFRVELEEPPKAVAAANAQSPQKPASESAMAHSAKFSSHADYANEGGREDFNVRRERRVPQNQRFTNPQETARPPATDEVQQKSRNCTWDPLRIRTSVMRGAIMILVQTGTQEGITASNNKTRHQIVRGSVRTLTTGISRWEQRTSVRRKDRRMLPLLKRGSVGRTLGATELAFLSKQTRLEQGHIVREASCLIGYGGIGEL
ncbi:hypothetical protein MLD38_027150 [Melastoma candidum]|uniref:Uncharacterized protein n=1 Tax=Melastoma candidum TaxID=119954 RepID=A0ACB9P6Y2_9MYRT|nr:hypothetical protein MLD38_027150 [Melastoma candidum]